MKIKLKIPITQLEQSMERLTEDSGRRQTIRTSKVGDLAEISQNNLNFKK